jgi:hypothetical protein
MRLRPIFDAILGRHRIVIPIDGYVTMAWARDRSLTVIKGQKADLRIEFKTAKL